MLKYWTNTLYLVFEIFELNSFALQKQGSVVQGI